MKRTDFKLSPLVCDRCGQEPNKIGGGTSVGQLCSRYKVSYWGGHQKEQCKGTLKRKKSK
jgi:hypothetical protein